MVIINLVPEIVVQARNARRRARNLLLLTCASIVTFVGAIFFQNMLLAFRGYDRQSMQRLATELEALRETVRARRKDVGQYERESDTRRGVRVSQKTIAERLACIASLIPRHATLSSLQLSEHQLVLAGVASERSVVSNLVGNLGHDVFGGSISVERLKDVSVERHVLQEFVVRAEGLKNHNQQSGAIHSVIREIHRHE